MDICYKYDVSLREIPESDRLPAKITEFEYDNNNYDLCHILFCRYQLFQKPFEATFPYEDIVPLQHHMFLGVNASFPNNIAAVLRRRYGRLYRIPIPYKWKCYLNTTSIMCLILLAIFLSSVIYYRKQRSR